VNDENVVIVVIVPIVVIVIIVIIVVIAGNLATTSTFMKSYKDLEIHQIAFELAAKIYSKSLELPNHDKFEIGSQIRQSSQAIKDAIAEGYGRKKYKADFIKFLIYAHASQLEAKSQAEFIFHIHQIDSWKHIAEELDNLGIKINNFINYVEKNWKT